MERYFLQGPRGRKPVQKMYIAFDFAPYALATMVLTFSGGKVAGTIASNDRRETYCLIFGCKSIFFRAIVQRKRDGVVIASLLVDPDEASHKLLFDIVRKTRKRFT